MSLDRKGPEAEVDAKLRVAGGHDWSFEAIEAHKKAEFERHMPQNYRLLHKVHPRMPGMVVILFLLAGAYTIIVALSIDNVIAGGFCAALAGLLLGSALLLDCDRQQMKRSQWDSVSIEEYERRHDTLPAGIRETIRATRVFYPESIFRIEVFGKDPILWWCMPEVISRPIRVWNLDGTDELPPSA
jgi:hypothetical protein